MIGIVISSIILAGVLTTYIICMRGFRAISNYAEIHSGGRIAIDQFARDMRAVNSVTSYAASNLVVTIPTAFSATGTVLTNKTVTYSVNGGTLYRTDSATGNTKLMVRNIYDLRFVLYDKVGSPTTILNNAKGVQVDLKLRKYVQSQIQSEDFLSARLDMRNIQ